MREILFILLFSLAMFSCSNKEVKEDVIVEKSLDMQVLEAYEEGVKALKSNEVIVSLECRFNFSREAKS